MQHEKKIHLGKQMLNTISTLDMQKIWLRTLKFPQNAKGTLQHIRNMQTDERASL